jgi:hypothetical protein
MAAHLPVTSHLKLRRKTDEEIIRLNNGSANFLPIF